MLGDPGGKFIIVQDQGGQNINISMDHEETGVDTRNWTQIRVFLESPCECGIETPGSIRLRDS